jgi:hypothetical protein
MFPAGRSPPPPVVLDSGMAGFSRFAAILPQPSGPGTSAPQHRLTLPGAVAESRLMAATLRNCCSVAAPRLQRVLVGQCRGARAFSSRACRDCRRTVQRVSCRNQWHGDQAGACRRQCRTARAALRPRWSLRDSTRETTEDIRAGAQLHGGASIIWRFTRGCCHRASCCTAWAYRQVLVLTRRCRRRGAVHVFRFRRMLKFRAVHALW